jgi:FKBP-type peptidyl-prolyl cis-trans isomerase
LGVHDLVTGTGAIGAACNRVSVHFSGWLNGAKFDTSLNRGPTTFRLGLGDVLRGWDLGIAGMKVGGKRKLTVPPDLGYGHKGSLGGAIPPDSVLVFEIDLLSATDG